MSKLPWVRVSNSTQDPITKFSVAQDQIVKLVGDDGDWYHIVSTEGKPGRVPKVLTLPLTDPPRQPGQKLYCSVDSYTSIRADDLSFGPYILIVAWPSTSQEGWLEGYAVNDNGNKLGSNGFVPEGYLVPLEDSPDIPPISGITSSFTTNFDEIDVKFRQGQTESVRLYSVVPYARAMYNFQGEFSNELSFKSDEIITLRKRIDSEWLEGSIGSERIGIFPASFVQIIVNLPEDEQLDKRKSTDNEGIGFATVNHSFVGRQSDELSVRTGDVVRVLQLVNDEWVLCKNPDSETTGIVPVGFLELYLDDEDDDGRGNSSTKTSAPESLLNTVNRNSFIPQRSSASVTSSRVEESNFTSSSNQMHQWATFGDDWISDEQPKAVAPARPPPPKQELITSPNNISENYGTSEINSPPSSSIPQLIYETTSDFEIGIASVTKGAETNDDKRCKVLEELINSELQFITDINCYVDAVNSTTILGHKQKVLMKNGCAQIVQLSGNLVQLLTNEQIKPVDSQAIGMCFLQLRKPFAQTYGYYFRNIEHINQMLTSAKTERSMQDALNNIVQLMRKNGSTVIDGATAVGRPVQRCLRYPLFLNEITKLTNVTHSDHPKLLEAVKMMSNLGQRMNESKRRKELTKKYMSDDKQSIGDLISKMTLHSLKKKSNRFTYRMGSSLGVVKLQRDAQFDRLVCELDSAERRLVRFNYMLVIYRKKMYHETRVLLQKRLVEPRKKYVSNNDIEHQLYLYNEAVRVFSDVINSRVRDEIVKALRNLPKRLIKKRNDKLMDYEAAKSKEKGNTKRDFLEIQKDYEALNMQVKQQLPKSIDYLNKVLADAMKVVQIEDRELMAKLRHLFENAKTAVSVDKIKKLVQENTPCFVDYYDPDRLKPLQKIANKGAHCARMRSKSLSPKSSKNFKDMEVPVGKYPDKKSLADDLNVEIDQWNNSVEPQNSKTEFNPKFRAQTAIERKTILEKAKIKGRMLDMFIVTSHYPQDPTMMKLAQTEGKLLIVRQNDIVLVVNRSVPSMWLCYNGYYNAPLPSEILQQYSEVSNCSTPAPIETGFDVARNLNIRCHSTPPKSQNLIDLEDIFGSALSEPIKPEPLQKPPEPIKDIHTTISSQTSVPINLNCKEDKNLTWTPATPTKLFFDDSKKLDPTQTSSRNVNYNLDDDDIFDGVTSINWGAPNITTPSLSNSANTSNDIAKTFDELPSSTQQPFPMVNYEEPINDPWVAPVSNTTMRMESPQPLIPSRPMVNNNGIYSDSQNASSYNNYSHAQDFCDQKPNIKLVQPCLYDTTPFEKPSGNENNFYESPPAQVSSSSLYDQPPNVSIIQPVISVVRADYDFIPQGSNQVALTAGEKANVLQKNDDDGNAEWLLVKKSDGQVGYVPSSYCRTV